MNRGRSFTKIDYILTMAKAILKKLLEPCRKTLPANCVSGPLTTIKMGELTCLYQEELIHGITLSLFRALSYAMTARMARLNLRM